jgi:hypothetical protein
MALTQKEDSPPSNAIMDLGKGTFGSSVTYVMFLL